MSTLEDRIWDAHQERVWDDRSARFNAEHGHLSDCEFVVDGWLCTPNCQGEP